MHQKDFFWIYYRPHHQNRLIQYPIGLSDTTYTIPATVTSIDTGAFQGCSRLTSFAVATGNTIFSVLNNVLFNTSGVTATLVQYPIGLSNSTYTIPTTVSTKMVTTINQGAFQGCSALASITIPTGVTTIGMSVFQGCSALASVTIPTGLVTISDSAFQGCSALASVTIPIGVTSITTSMFQGCSALASVTIPISVTSIGVSAFQDCSALASVLLPRVNDFNTISASAFQGCSKITNIMIPNNVTLIDTSAFQGCSKITSVTIPSSITGVNNSVFQGCSSLTSVTIPNTIFTIGIRWFQGCSSLTSFNIPMNFTAVNNSVFQGCSSLQSVTIPKSIQSINNGAFQDCSSLTEVRFMGNIPSVSSNNFTNTNDTAYYNPGVNNTSILPSFFTNLVENENPLSTKPSKPVISNVTVSNLTATIVLAATTDTIINYSYSLTTDGTTYTPFSPIQSSSPLQISGLTNGTTYTFRVKAIGTNASSDASEPYGPVLVASVPSAPTISSVTVSSGTATIAFTEGANNGSAITSYKYSKDNGSNWVSVSTTSSPITVTGLNNGSTYTFVIRAVNAIGDGESSNAVEKLVNVAPGAPTITNVTISSGISKIAFTAGENTGSPVTSYKYSKDNGSNWVSVSTTSSPIEISGLKPGIRHQIILKASNGSDSDPSNTYTFTYYVKQGTKL
jgi:hypothetical protein